MARREKLPVPAASSPRPAPVVAEGAALEPREPSLAELGRRIRMLRVTRGLTLKDLEQRGGISATHVSEIERGRASPTIGALERLARALGVSSAALVEASATPEVVVRRRDEPQRTTLRIGRAEVQPIGGGVREGSFGAQLVTVPPGREPVFEHEHAGEQWVLVLEGAVEVRIGAEAWLLREGDSIHFRSHRRHSYANLASAPATLLVANRPGASLRDSV
jgi:transcriptional regulator with XRE-family HTH domain